jgi:MOSC domain-containing protein YiiM
VAPARVASIQVSRGGVPKSSVFEALVTEAGLDGDRQQDLRYHGGPDRAVVLFSLDIIQALQREGHPITPGGVGENVTIAGLDWNELQPGRILQIGSVQLRLTTFTSPCRKIAGSFMNRNYMRVSQDEHPGSSRVCARVLAGGIVRPGDDVALLPSV